MHPFSLKQENTKDVTGGALEAITYGCTETGGGIIIPQPFPPIETTTAIGEEGGLPIDPTW